MALLANKFEAQDGPQMDETIFISHTIVQFH